MLIFKVFPSSNTKTPKTTNFLITLLHQGNQNLKEMLFVHLLFFLVKIDPYLTSSKKEIFALWSVRKGNGILCKFLSAGYNTVVKKFVIFRIFWKLSKNIEICINTTCLCSIFKLFHEMSSKHYKLFNNFIISRRSKSKNTLPFIDILHSKFLEMKFYFQRVIVAPVRQK